MAGMSVDQMKEKFASMKEQMKSRNPEMAKKMEAFESKVKSLTDGGVSAKDAAKQVAGEMGLPDFESVMKKMQSGQTKGGFGMPKSSDDDSSKSYQAPRTLNYSFNGQAQQSAALQGLLDMLG